MIAEQNLSEPLAQTFTVGASSSGFGAFNDTYWYPDSGATNHITSNQTNLTSKSEFVGPEQVHIGDGQGLSIKHIGSSAFSSPYTSKTMSLNSLLHVPQITKNCLVYPILS